MAKIGISLAALTLLLGMAAAQSSRPANQKEQVSRGEYLVHHVAMCVQCHTPRDDRGDLIRQELLQGAVLPVKSPYRDQPWAFRAPSLAGLPGGWSEEDLVRLLTTGRNINGHAPQPPMPSYRMTREDAAAIAAYLKVVRPGGETSSPKP